MFITMDEHNYGTTVVVVFCITVDTACKEGWCHEHYLGIQSESDSKGGGIKVQNYCVFFIQGSYVHSAWKDHWVKGGSSVTVVVVFCITVDTACKEGWCHEYYQDINLDIYFLYLDLSKKTFF